MKLITSLGTGSYKTTKYVWNGRGEETSYFPQALVKWLRPDSVLVLLTEEAARCNNWKDFEKWLVEEQVEYESKTIPEGRTEQQVWQIFEQVVDNVGEGEEVVIDITHAFRSLPLIFFVVTAFLRVHKKVQVRHVLYGCYIPDQTESPVVDLRLMLDLLDWMEGTRQIRSTWDARMIGQKLGKLSDSSLRKSGEHLLQLTNCIHLGRLREVMSKAQELRDHLRSASDNAEKLAPPFALLWEEIYEQVDRWAEISPSDLNKATLCKQRDLVVDMVEAGLTWQAVHLAREWMVNWTIWQQRRDQRLMGDVWLVETARGEAERLLNASKEAQSSIWDEKTNSLVWEIWSDLRELRNDLAHCGMRDNATKASRIEGRAKDILQRLHKLPVNE